MATKTKQKRSLTLCLQRDCSRQWFDYVDLVITPATGSTDGPDVKEVIEAAVEAIGGDPEVVLAAIHNRTVEVEVGRKTYQVQFGGYCDQSDECDDEVGDWELSE